MKMTLYKKFLSMILALASISSFSVKAGSNQMDIAGYLDSISEKSTFYAKDSEGNDVTASLLYIIDNVSAEEAVLYITEIDGVFGYIDTKVSDSVSDENSTAVLEESVTVTNEETKSKTVGSKTYSWTTRLTGTYYCDSHTGLIRRAANPTLILVYAYFGTEYSPYFGSASTYSSISSDQSYVTFSANYQMCSSVSTEYGTYNIVLGNYTHQFTRS